MVSENSNIDEPNGWPLNKSSHRPSGNPAQIGSRPGRNWCQAISRSSAIGGTTGADEMIGSIGVSDASITLSHGIP